MQRPGARLARALERRSVALVLGGTGVLWCASSVAELVLASAAPRALVAVNFGFAFVVLIELVLRLRAAPRARSFVRDAWTDLVAVVPIAFGMHAPPAIVLLRFFRLARVFALMRRHRIFAALSRGQRQLATGAVLVAAIVVFATAAMLAFEREPGAAAGAARGAFWFSVFSFFANQPIPEPPHTFAGRLVSIGLMVSGVTTFAVFTGTISALMIERIRAEGELTDGDELEGHVVICGWNRKAEIIVSEHVAAKHEAPIVVIARFEGEPTFADASLRRAVQFVNEDFTKVSALERAGIRRAATCILLSDMTRGRNERDADARTILAALTVEKLNPAIYCCAELNRREYSSHLELGKVEQVVVSGEHSAFLLAHAALSRTVLDVFTELLSYHVGHRFVRIAAPASWAEMTFTDALVALKKEHDAILIGVQGKDGRMRINPMDFRFRGGEPSIVIASRDFRL